MNNFIPSSKAKAIYRQSKPKSVQTHFQTPAKIMTKYFQEGFRISKKGTIRKQKLAHNDSKHSEPKRLR